MTLEVPCQRHQGCNHVAVLVLDGYDDPKAAAALTALCCRVGVMIWVEDHDPGTL